MGLWDKVVGQFIDVIEWVDDTKDTLIWKFPRYDNEIKNGAQLIVRESQVAVFIHEGEMGDIFGPGRYELTEPLVLSREDTRIEGAGAATHIVNKNENGHPALVLRASTKGERIWRVQLADFRVSGNPKSGDGLPMAWIEINGAPETLPC